MTTYEWMLCMMQNDNAKIYEIKDYIHVTMNVWINIKCECMFIYTMLSNMICNWQHNWHDLNIMRNNACLYPKRYLFMIYECKCDTLISMNKQMVRGRGMQNSPFVPSIRFSIVALKV